MLIDKRQAKDKVDIRSKFHSFSNMKRKYSPRKNRNQESESFVSYGSVGSSKRHKEDGNTYRQRDELLNLLKENNKNAAPFSIKNIKVYTKYANFYKWSIFFL